MAVHKLLLMALALAGISPAIAQQWPVPVAAREAAERKDHRQAAATILAELKQCEAVEPSRCALLLMWAGSETFQFDYKAAERLARRAVTLTGPPDGKSYPDRAHALDFLALTLGSQGRFVEAEAPRREALALLGQNRPEADLRVADGYNQLASVLDRLSRHSEAEVFLRRMLLLLHERHRPPGHLLIAMSYNNLAENLASQARYVEAEPLYRKAMVLREQLSPSDPSALAASYEGLGLALINLSRADEAEPLLRRVIDIRVKTFGAEEYIVAWSYDNLAMLLENRGDFREAESLRRKSLEIQEASWPAGHLTIAAGAAMLASNIDLQARYVEAEPLHRKAMAAYAAVTPEDAPAMADLYDSFAFNLEGRGRDKEAERFYRRSVRARATRPAAHPARIFGYRSLAGFLRDHDRSWPEVRSLYRAAQAGIFDRLATYSSFDREAQIELRGYQPVFTGQVRAAWTLSNMPARP